MADNKLLVVRSLNLLSPGSGPMRSIIHYEEEDVIKEQDFLDVHGEGELQRWLGTGALKRIE